MPTTRARRWEDLSGGQQAAVVVLGIVQVSLLIAALLDIRRRPAEQIRGSKWAWTAVSFINFIGPLSYFVYGRKS